jgi:hypothetical protein
LPTPGQDRLIAQHALDLGAPTVDQAGEGVAREGRLERIGPRRAMPGTSCGSRTT